MNSVKNALWIIAGILLIGLIGFMFWLAINNASPLSLGNYNPQQSQSTVDSTKVAAITPTWSTGDMATSVRAAKPTPYQKWTLSDAKAYKAAIADKNRLFGTDILIGAQYQSQDVEWYCEDLTALGINLPYSTIASAVAMESTFSYGTYLHSLQIDVGRGKEVAIYHDGDKPYVEHTYQAIITITVPSSGVLGPEIRWDNQVLLNVGDANVAYKALLIPREVLSGQDPIGDKRTLVENLALKRATIESLTPNGSDVHLQALRQQFITSLSTPAADGQPPHIYDTFLALMEPMAKSYGFSGIENVVVIAPQLAKDTHGWTYLDTGDSVLPADYPELFSKSTCPSPKPDPATEKLLYTPKLTPTP